jgi:hypothetical protein
MANGSSQEELQKDVDNIWSAEVAAHESWLATQTSISVPSGDPRVSAWPTPSGHPKSSGGWHFHGGQGGARKSTFTTEVSSSASSVAGDS